MKAEAQSFASIMANKYIEVPFFQREYVWEEKNWRDLIDNLLDVDDTHFLGSVILKLRGTRDGVAEWSIIDGQQRLTTLSLLFDICCKVLQQINHEFYEEKRKEMLFIKTQAPNGQGMALVPKLRHSETDRGAFETCVLGHSSHPLRSKGVLECHEWFKNHFVQNEADAIEDARRIFNLLTDWQRPILVGIELHESDNEQSIFDTINSAGVRLTAADTIKNHLFQRLLDLSGNEHVDEVVGVYEQFWKMTFSDSSETLNYWSSEFSQGRINRTAQEILLHCVAVVEGFYDPNRHSTNELATCYKEHIDNIDSASVLRDFAENIACYAKRYRDFFGSVADGYLYQFNDVCGKTLNILRSCDTSTFDPLILKLLTDHPPAEDGTISEELRKGLDAIAQYVLLHVVCGESTKNFNKECSMAIAGTKTLAEHLVEKVSEGRISDEGVRSGLKRMKHNTIARCILFWLELKRRSHQFSDINALHDTTMSLEHIMPQKWMEFWPVSMPPVVDAETGVVLNRPDVAELRKCAVYEIGNMALVNQKLNTSIRNRAIREKVLGNGPRKPGLGASDMLYTKDVVGLVTGNNFLWNEKTIRDRTNKLTEEFLETWGAGEVQHVESAETLHAVSSPAVSPEILPQSNDVAGTSQMLAMPESALSDTQLKIGKIAKTIFPVLFAENKITDEDIEFLTSDAGHLCFKTTGKVLKETSGDIDADAKDAHGKKRFYSNIVLSYGGKQYLLTREWFEKGKAPLMAWITNHGVSQDHVLALCMPKTATSKVLDKYDADMQSLMADLRAGKIKAKMSEGRFAMEEDRYDKVAAGKVDREWVLLTRGQLKRSVGIKTVRLYKFDGTLKPKVYMRWEVVSVGLEGEDSNGDSCECDVVNVPDGFKPESIVIHLGKRIG